MRAESPLKYAIRNGRLSRNPADGIGLPRIRQKKHPYLTHAQLHELAALCGSEGPVGLFLGYTGLRWESWRRSRCAAMTLDVYVDLFDDDLDAVGDALSRLGSPESVGKPWANPETEGLGEARNGRRSQ